ncbi:MAG TPA: CBS domain-containing protein [Anaerolineaceae bacterium]|nr:CBS domain-containing protein [Anaerolineaceae bacterium]
MTTVRNLLEIKGKDIWSVGPDATVYEALRLMADKDIGALVVMQGDQMVGIVSERDYARKIILHGKSSRDTLVREVMTSRVFTIHPDQTIEEVMELMTKKRVRHLPVTEGDQLIGVISIGDVVKDVIYHQRKVISSLEDKVYKREQP